MGKRHYHGGEIGSYCWAEGIRVNGEITQDYANGNKEHVTQILWAQSDGAARRIWERSIESDVSSNAELPLQLSIGVSKPTYANLLKALSTRFPEKTIESASYRIATDGKFVFKTIAADNFEYYFRSSNDNPFELPFGASYSNVTNS